MIEQFFLTEKINSKQAQKKKTFWVLLFLIFSSFISAQSVIGINTLTPNTTLDINGELTIRETNYLNNNLQPLYIDSDGKVGLRPAGNFLTKKAFFATTTTVLLQNLGKQFNNLDVIVLPFLANQIKYNTIGVENTGNYFKITKDGLYQIDGFVNFLIYTSSGSNTFMVVRIEVSTDDGQTWDLITGLNRVFIQAWSPGQNHPLNIPSGVSYLTSGNLLRMSLNRTSADGIGLGTAVNNLQVSPDSDYATKTYQLAIEKLDE